MNASNPNGIIKHIIQAEKLMKMYRKVLKISHKIKIMKQMNIEAIIFFGLGHLLLTQICA